MTGDEVIALLGTPAGAPAVTDLLDAWGVRWPPRLDDADPEAVGDAVDPYVWRPSSKRGIEFGFTDEAYQQALSEDDRGRGPLVCTHAIFYGEHPGVLPFDGEVPFGLALADGREHVQTDLSGRWGPARTHRRDAWDVPDHRIVVEHTDDGQRMDSLLVKRPLQPWPPADTATPPTPDEIRSCFGEPWYGETMQKLFFPLGLARCGPGIARNRTGDLRREVGLELFFDREPGLGDASPLKDKGLGLAGAKLFANRFQDARQWPGGLPLGLTFKTAFPDVVSAVGRPPDGGQDGHLSGHAVWHLKDYTLHVQYDNVDNVLWSVSMLRPGFWTASDSLPLG